MVLDLTNDNSTLVQVMAWCRRGWVFPEYITARAWQLPGKKPMGFVSYSGHVRALMHAGLAITSGFLLSRWRGKRSRHSRGMSNPQLYVSDKMPIVLAVISRGTFKDKIR